MLERLWLVVVIVSRLTFGNNLFDQLFTGYIKLSCWAFSALLVLGF